MGLKTLSEIEIKLGTDNAGSCQIKICAPDYLSEQSTEQVAEDIKSLLIKLEKLRLTNTDLPDLLGEIYVKHQNACNLSGVKSEEHPALEIIVGHNHSCYCPPVVGNFEPACILIEGKIQHGYRVGEGDDSQPTPYYSLGNLKDAIIHELVHAGDPRLKTAQQVFATLVPEGKGYNYLAEYYAMRLTNLFMKALGVPYHPRYLDYEDTLPLESLDNTNGHL